MDASRNERVAAVVCQAVALECLGTRGDSRRLDSVFRYDSRDPWAITIDFRTPAGELPWTFARELLMHGLTTPTGEGDVHVWPAVTAHGRAVLQVALSSPDGHLLLRARADDVYRFLTRTLEAVPPGQETQHLDVDRLVARLLGG